MAYEIPASFMAQFEIKLCPECQLEHAAVRTCDEAREFQKTLADLDPAGTKDDKSLFLQTDAALSAEIDDIESRD